MPGGPILSFIFFGAFLMAAFSSLLPMMQLLIKNLTDYTLTKKQAAFVAGACCFVIGFPSAYSLDFFKNQDWVWGLGLLVSGIFLAFLIIRYGPTKYKRILLMKVLILLSLIGILKSWSTPFSYSVYS